MGKRGGFVKLGETATTSIILNNINSGDDKKTADINNLTSGVYYFYYDNMWASTIFLFLYF